MDIMFLVGAVLFFILALIFGGLLSGCDRVLTARFQSRVGPPILQPFMMWHNSRSSSLLHKIAFSEKARNRRQSRIFSLVEIISLCGKRSVLYMHLMILVLIAFSSDSNARNRRQSPVCGLLQESHFAHWYEMTPS